MSYLHELPTTTATVSDVRDARRQIAFSEVGDESTLVKRPEKFNVFIRLKPLNILRISDELNKDYFSIEGEELTTKLTNPKNETIKSKYSFTKIFLPSTPQSVIFNTAVKSNLEMFLGGDNSLVFAYGTSGSGKTYTMQGTYTEPGIIPRILYSIFHSIQGHEDKTGRYNPNGGLVYINDEDQATENLRYKNKILNIAKKQVYKNQEKLAHNDTISFASHKNMNESLKGLKKINVEATANTVFSVWISMCEIYNENLNDLLVQREDQVPLRFVEDNSNIIVKGLKQIPVSTWEEAYEVYRYGKHNLHVSETNINKKSSRSHCVFNIKLVKRDVTKPTKFENVSSFIVCDLAGSERITKTGSRKQISKEATSINTSLFVLNKCIELIRKSQQLGTSLRIPFRESKLTRLLSKNLLGEGTVNIIVNITQEGDFSGETQQTLRATANASEIEIKPFREQNVKRQMAVAAESLENLHLDELNTQIDDYKSTIQKQQKEIEELKQALTKERENAKLKEKLLDNSSKQKEEYRLQAIEISDLRLKIFLLNSEKEALETEIHNGKLDLISCFNIPGDPGLEDAVRYACKKITSYRHYYALKVEEHEEEIEEYEKEIGILRGMVMNLEEQQKEQDILHGLTIAKEPSDEDTFSVETETRDVLAEKENNGGIKNLSSENETEDVLAEKENNGEIKNLSSENETEDVLAEKENNNQVKNVSSETFLVKPDVAEPTQIVQDDVSETFLKTETKKSTRKKLLPKTQDDFLGDDFVPIDTPRKERALSTNTFIKSLKKPK